MSKEQTRSNTPITAEEWSVEEHIEALLILRGFSKDLIVNNRDLIGAIIEDMEEYAQAKVLEALEREVVKFSKHAFKEAKAAVIWSNDSAVIWSNDYPLHVAKNYIETQVKPKYE